MRGVFVVLAGLLAASAVSAQELTPDSPKLAVETPAVDIGLAVDPKAAAVSGLFELLAQESERAAEEFKAQADADYAERGTSGTWNAYFLDRVSSVTFQSDRLVSVFTAIDSYSGGAHPNQNFATLLYDAEKGAPITADVLMPGFTADGEAFLAMQAYAQERLKFERAQRLSIDEVPPEDMEWIYEGTANPGELATFTVMPSETPGVASGLKLHFAPYQVGSYAEGPYEVEVPALVFTDYLAPEYRALFDGG